jgi:hypothetical protein
LSAGLTSWRNSLSARATICRCTDGWSASPVPSAARGMLISS